MRKKRRLRAAAISAQLPEDVLLGGARVTLMAQGSALVEGQRGVVELSHERIRLRTKSGIVSVLGTSLSLRELSLDAALIMGDPIVTITYGRPEGGASWTHGRAHADNGSD